MLKKASLENDNKESYQDDLYLGDEDKFIDNYY